MTKQNTQKNTQSTKQNKKIKTLNTLQHELASENIRATATTIINNTDDIDVDTLSRNELFAVLIYRELAKALKTKSTELLLDCNYAQSRATAKTVKVFKLITDVNTDKSVIQLHCKCNAKTAKAYFGICFSCAKTVQAQDDALKKAQFEVVKTAKRATKTRREKVDYSEVVQVVKQALAILATAKTAKATADKSDSDE